MLVMLGIKYDSIEAINLADTMGKLLEVTAWEASAELAVEKGAFPLWTTSRAAKRIEKKHAVPVRNADITTIAPTGTISLLADCSSGIEPHFAREWTRRALWNKGTSTELAESAPDDPNVRTAHEVLPNMHIEMQAAWQKHISNSISKTINMKQDCNVGDVRNAFWHAWKTGCKSVTIYREGSRDIEVLSTGLLEEDVTPILKRPSRPSILEGKTHKLQTADGTLYVIVNVHNEEPFEVFATLGKGGTGVAASLEAISRLISVGLQTGTPLDLIIKQLRGITDNPVGFGGRQIKSVPDAISQVLEKYQPVPKSGGTDKKVLKMGELGSEWKPLSAMPKDPPRGESCPECSGELVMASGCAHCPDCGFERC
jgi:ribonucleoside-diphosphate reductase alpha chain